MTLSEPTRRTLRHSFLAFAAGYCVVFVACQKADVETCPSGRFCPAGSHCAARQDICISTPCGNGKIDAGEVCDDGNLVDGDGCNSTCTSNETCGNGIKDKNEECDYVASPQNCTTICTSNVCGNGRVDDPREECDPGPNGTTAQCLASCKESKRGDGWVNPRTTPPEECDRDAIGNAVAGPGDDCEWVGTIGTTGIACNADCTPSRHGDGRVNRSDGEQCDVDGVPLSSTAFHASCESQSCNADCTWSVCGDHKLNPADGETCDDGNRDNFDDCTNACTTNSCGDGIQQLRGARIEECDRGSGNVDPTALLTCSYGQTCPFCLQGSCTVTTVVGPYCGDGEVQERPVADPPEECDNLTSQACGTCSGCRRVWPRAAQGAIDVKNASSIVAGDTITIDDGTTSAVLEFSPFDSSSCTTAVHTCVNLRNVQRNPSDVAGRIRYAMSGWASRISPVSGSGNPIPLRHASEGLYYNRRITVHGSSVAVAPADAAVVVNGMAGGAGCRVNEACTSSWDCAGSSICSNRTCQ